MNDQFRHRPEATEHARHKPGTGLIAFGLVVAGSAFPGVADAEQLAFGGGVTAMSDYLSEGVSQTGGRPAIQANVEAGLGGLHGGIWASTLRDTDGNRAEVDLYGGYRGVTAGGIGYDVGYAQHFFDKTHDFSAEITTGLSYQMTDRLNLLGEVSYDLGEKALGGTVGLEYGVTDALALTGEVGRADPASATYYAVGASYDFNESYGLELQYQKPRSASGSVALLLNYRFGALGE